jgi:hypothetical protein
MTNNEQLFLPNKL